MKIEYTLKINLDVSPETLEDLETPASFECRILAEDNATAEAQSELLVEAIDERFFLFAELTLDGVIVSAWKLP